MLVCVQDGGPSLVLYVQAYGAGLVFYYSVLSWRCWLCVLLVDGAGFVFCWLTVLALCSAGVFKMVVLALCSDG